LTLVKIWGGVSEISLYQLSKLYLRPNLSNTFDGHPLRGCWARCIDKKRNKLEIAAIANALQLVGAWKTPALFRFNYNVMPSLTSLNLFIIATL